MQRDIARPCLVQLPDTVAWSSYPTQQLGPLSSPEKVRFRAIQTCQPLAVAVSDILHKGCINMYFKLQARMRDDTTYKTVLNHTVVARV